jgi:peptidyl-prolyl cis-trans isomerase C
MNGGGMRKSISQVASQPLIQFLVLGAVFYGLYAWSIGSRTGEPDNVIRVTVADVSRLDAAWRARWNRPPTQEELAGLVRSYVQEIALYRHAMAMGLDQNDPVVRRMLGQKLQNLSQNLLELSLSPTEQELRTYFTANQERYQLPDLITFTQIFLNPDRRGDETLQDAEEILSELRSLAEPTEGIEGLGDSFMLQRYYPQKTKLEISKLFGQGFTQSVFELSPGEWHGPVLSGYGVHLVYVHDHAESPAPEFAAVEERVKQDWLDDKRRELQGKFVSDVLASYEVVFEDLPDETPEQGAEAEPETSE